MSLKFTGRESQLTDIENLIQAKQGACPAMQELAKVRFSMCCAAVAKCNQSFVECKVYANDYFQVSIL